MDVRLDSRILFSPTSSGQNLQKPSHLILDLKGYKFNFYEDEFTDFIILPIRPDYQLDI